MDNSNGFKGNLDPHTASSEYGERDYHVRQVTGEMNICIPVRVVAVNNTGGLSAAGLLDVQPLVQLRDGYGNVVDVNTIHDVPYFRLLGGTNAVIIDPVVGDIGFCVIADRDISIFKGSQQVSPPGSDRRNSMSDAIYIGGILNGTPQQVVRFAPDGIHVTSPSKVFVEAPTVEIDATTACNINAPQIGLNGAITQGSGSYGGTATFGQNIIFNGSSVQHQGKEIGKTHTHGGVTSGSSNTNVVN